MKFVSRLDSPLTANGDDVAGVNLRAPAKPRGKASVPIAGLATHTEVGTAVALLLVAIVLGVVLRFYALGGREMSADEGASWAAASASSVTQVLQLQPQKNPGKFALHEIVLHGWSKVFGDGLAAMRALSALAGTGSILLVFFLVQELLSLDHALSDNTDGGIPSYALPAAIVTLLFAVNLVFIKYAREARMYSIALLCALIQVELFLKSLRRPTPISLVLAALFTAFAIAGNFTMVLILAPETLWVPYLARRRGTIRTHAALTLLALTAGLVLLIPPAIIYLRARAHAPVLLSYAWSLRPPFWAPVSMFNKANGSVAFPVMLGLALWGLVCEWRQERDSTVFILLWMLLPPTLVLSASYLSRPAFVERYMLASFVPFFALAGLGIWHIRQSLARLAVMALAVALALGHDYSYALHPHDVQWNEAVQTATSMPGHEISVAPPYAADVVHYYLRASRGDWSIETVQAKTAGAAIVADTGVSPAQSAHIAVVYPRLLRRLRGVIVRGH
jgi:mannosyltransferase